MLLLAQGALHAARFLFYPITGEWHFGRNLVVSRLHREHVAEWIGKKRGGQGREGNGRRAGEEGGGGGRGAGRGGTAWPSLWVGTAESAFSGLSTSEWLGRASSSADMTPSGGAASAPPHIGGVPGVHDRCPLWHRPCSAQRAVCAAMFHARQDGAARRHVSGGETGLS